VPLVVVGIADNLLHPVLVVLRIMRPPARPVDVQPLYHLFLVKTVLSIVMIASRLNVPHAVLAMSAMKLVTIAGAVIATVVMVVVGMVSGIVTVIVAIGVTAARTAIAGKPGSKEIKNVSERTGQSPVLSDTFLTSS
jgi:hypothetical protein